MISIKKIYHQWLERKAILFDTIMREKRDAAFRSQVGYMDATADIQTPSYCPVPQKVFFYEGTFLDQGAQLVISAHGEKGKFVMMPHAEAAVGLTVVTNAHVREIGEFLGDTERKRTSDKNTDIVVEEDVWIGANVILLPGCRVGRGSVIGAGAVCNKKIPPYAIVMGNPAKVIGFVFTPDEVIEHEEKLYPEEKRLRREVLERNYERYYTSRLEEIKEILK